MGRAPARTPTCRPDLVNRKPLPSLHFFFTHPCLKTSHAGVNVSLELLLCLICALSRARSDPQSCRPALQAPQQDAAEEFKRWQNDRFRPNNDHLESGPTVGWEKLLT